MIKNIREYENLHIALWLIKDTCWVCDFKIGGIIMLVPTLLAAFHIAWRSRGVISDLLHNIAVALWICANGIWMIGEFFYDDGTRPYAMVFFVMGLFTVAAYYLFVLPRQKRKLAQETNAA